MEIKHNDLKTLYCHKCKEEIKEGDHVIIDVNNCVYCSEKCLFIDYGQDHEWAKYRRRKDKSVNFIDLGLMDVSYIGDYNKNCMKYINEGD